MFRARDPQRNLFSARNQYRDALDPKSFYALLADFGDELFDDYSFEYLYFEDNGRPCIPPGQMFTLLLLQMHDGCSDKEAIERACWDLRWAAALDLEPTTKLCGKSTLQEFRARILLNETAEKQFVNILELARKRGIIKGSLRVAIDTTPILGRGSVKDTYNLIGDGIRKLAQVLARIEKVSAEYWAGLHDFSRYWEASSLKGDAGIDWSDDAQRRVFLNSLVADAGRILLLADKLSKDALEDNSKKITEASALLRRLITQDTEPDPTPPFRSDAEPKDSEDAPIPQSANEPAGPVSADTETSREDSDPSGESESSVSASNADHLLEQMVRIRKGVAKDRLISAHDPEMRHGRKSATHRFNGHKLSIVADTNSKLILSLDILAGNDGDNTGTLELVKQAAQQSGLTVEKVLGDCAYGDGETRESFEQSGIILSAKVPSPHAKDTFPKSRFKLDLTNMIATCPEDKTTSDFGHYTHKNGKSKRFFFSAETCCGCPHKAECLRAVDKQAGRGRSVELHPQERLLQVARAHQASGAFREDIKARQVVEHRFANLARLGMRQARYIGRKKTKYQMLMLAMILNIKVVGECSLLMSLYRLSLISILSFLPLRKRKGAPQKSSPQSVTYNVPGPQIAVLGIAC